MCTFLSANLLFAQACCTGGTSLSSNLGIERTAENLLRLQLSYDYKTQQALVISEDTRTDRDYRVYPYIDYKSNHNYIAYPVAYQDERILSKERVHGIIKNSKSRVYRFSDFR